MSKRERIKKSTEKLDISGSETFTEKFKAKIPWIFGKKLRKPKITVPRITRRVVLPTPSKALGIALIYALLFILQTGVVYLIYREPPALGADSSGDPIFIYPGINDSFIVEGIVASILLFVSSTGFLMLYQASKHSYNRTIALRIMVIGIIMILIAYIFLQYMIAVKLGERAWWENL
jgi:hypothetical protein